jgi:molybdopterin molybdotransferase
MPELFEVVPPQQAMQLLLERLSVKIRCETVATAKALGRVIAQPLTAPEALPAFRRSTMDGYAVRAADTYGASESLPSYLTLVGEVKMGRSAELTIGSAEAAVVHTGGMLPQGADAVVMVERTQKLDEVTIEVLRPVAPGENIVDVGEDVRRNEALLESGHMLRPQDIGGLMALGILEVPVAAQPRVAIVSTGDEVVAPSEQPGPGQVRDVNTYTVSCLVSRAGGIPLPLGIVPDRFEAVLEAARTGLKSSDILVISAGSSVSVRDLTANVVAHLGEPGVVVHGVSLRPGKPTILGVCCGKPVFGLPGNPVSAMVVSELFLVPVVYRLQGIAQPPQIRFIKARLSHHVPSMAGREDYVPARVTELDGELQADPVFGKSSLIYTLVKADGLIVVPIDSNGLHEGDWVDVRLF